MEPRSNMTFISANESNVFDRVNLLKCFAFGGGGGVFLTLNERMRNIKLAKSQSFA